MAACVDGGGAVAIPKKKGLLEWSGMGSTYSLRSPLSKNLPLQQLLLQSWFNQSPKTVRLQEAGYHSRLLRYRTWREVRLPWAQHYRNEGVVGTPAKNDTIFGRERSSCARSPLEVSTSHVEVAKTAMGST